MKYHDVEKQGFYGAYWENKRSTDKAIITMLGDDPEDYMARQSVKWLMKNCGVNALTMSPGKKNYSHNNYPLERIENAVLWLKNSENNKIGIVGASTTGTLALTAASLFPDITLTIALTPSDFVWQGFAQGKKDGCKEWPIEGESLFTYKNVPLPYMPFCYSHPKYWEVMKDESKKTGNMLASHRIFDDSEAAHPITEEEFIKIENIKGMLLLAGASDDTLWDTVKYIKRAEKRLSSHPHLCDAKFLTYEHGTHFIFPDSLIKRIFPIFSKALLKIMFADAKKYANECQATRIDIENEIISTIEEWKNL